MTVIETRNENKELQKQDKLKIKQKREQKKKETENLVLGGNKRIILKSFSDEYWDKVKGTDYYVYETWLNGEIILHGDRDYTEEDLNLTYQHKKLPIRVNVEIELPIRGDGDQQTNWYGGYRNLEGNYNCRVVFRKFKEKWSSFGGYSNFRNEIGSYLKEFKIKIEKNEGELNFKEYKKLGKEKFVELYVDKHFKSDLLKQAFKHFVNVIEGRNSLRIDYMELNQFLDQTQPNWKDIYTEDLDGKNSSEQVKKFLKEKTKFDELVIEVYRFGERVKEEQEKNLVENFLTDEKKEEYNKLAEKLIGEKVGGKKLENDYRESERVEDIKQEQLEKIIEDDFVSKHSSMRDRINCIDFPVYSYFKEADKRIQERKKQWTEEQWKTYKPVNRWGVNINFDCEEWKDYCYSSFLYDQLNKDEDYKALDTEKQQELKKRKEKELWENISKKQPFAYECKVCKIAGLSDFKVVAKSKYILVYGCSRCAKVEYLFKKSEVKEALAKLNRKNEEE